MRIAIDAVGIAQPGGVRSATLNLLQALLRLDEENEYLILVERAEERLVPYANVTQHVMPTAHRLAVRAWAQATWPILFRRRQVDLVHHVKSLVTLGNPCPSLVTVLDLAMLRHPELYPRVDSLYWRTWGCLGVRAMDRVIAISRNTARDVEQLCGVPPERIRVIPLAVAECFTPASPEHVEEVRRRYGLSDDYLLHVGSIGPKKNLVVLARAYERLVRQHGFSGDLVLVGRRYTKEGDPALDDFLGQSDLAGRVHLTGPVPQEDLAALYSGAVCLVFPSRHEGFGLTPAQLMSRMVGEPDLRQALRRRGFAQRSRYSLRQLAGQTLDVYHELVGR